MQLVVLGMHRSGTSMVTRLLNMMSAYLGPEDVIMPLKDDNLKGFWERRDVRKLHDSVLRQLGCTWYRTSTFDLKRLDQEGKEVFVKGARNIIYALDANRPWAVKDPRICLLFPLWRELLEVPVCIHMFRSPLTVAKSLQKRNGFPLAFGMALWEQYTVHALRDTAGLPMAFVSFDELVADPIATVKELHSTLTELGVRRLDMPSDKEIIAYVDPKLVHYQDNDDAQYTTRFQSDLLDMLCQKDADAPYAELEVSAYAQGVIAEYQAVEAERNRLKAREEPLIELRQDLEAARDIAEKQKQELNKRAKPLVKKEAFLKDGARRLTCAEKSLAEARTQIKRLGFETAMGREMIRLQWLIEEKNYHIFVLVKRVHQQFDDGRLLIRWLEKTFKDVRAIQTSVRLWVGDKAVTAAVAAMRRSKTPTALDHIATLEKRFQNWCKTALCAKGLRPTAKTFPLDAGATVRHDTLTFQIKDKKGRISELQTESRQRGEEIRQAARWLEQVLNDLQALQGSARWRVGNLTLKVIELVLLRRRAASAFEHIQEIRTSFQRWRKGAETGPLQLTTVISRINMRVDLGNGALPVAQRPLGAAYRRATPDAMTGPAPMAAPPAIKSVSAIVLNRDGDGLLRNLFASFMEHNAHPDVEFIVVDHGSTDDSVVVVRSFADRMRIRVLELGKNQSFSVSNNMAAKESRADYLLFLNNDVVFAADVVGRLANALELDPVGLASCLLRYPEDHPEFPGKIQHVGATFDIDPDVAIPRPRNLDARFTSQAPGAPLTVRPAVTAAVMLCRREEFLGLGGFCEDYEYGLEDVDLCLTYLAKLGKASVCLNDVSMIHCGGVSLNKERADLAGEQRSNNLKTLEKRYGPQLGQAALLDRIAAKGFWTQTSLVVAFAVNETGDKSTAGDYFTALELSEACARELGWSVRLIAKDNWYDPAKLEGVDVMIAMVDGFELTKIREIREAMPGQVKVAWLRNWFQRWIDAVAFKDYDLVLCSSGIAADHVRQYLGVDAFVLPIAANTDRFTSGEAVNELRSDLCFTGSRWNVERDIEECLDPDALATLGYDFALYGAGWEQSETLAQYAKGFLPYERMPDVYRSTKIVIDDANHVTKDWGALNSRVFDALACGALVVTNNAKGAAELFNGLLPSYGSKEELTGLITQYLQDDVARTELKEKLRAMVLESHSYGRRAQTLKQILLDHVGKALDAAQTFPDVSDLELPFPPVFAGLLPSSSEALMAQDGEGQDMRLISDQEKEDIAAQLRQRPQQALISVVMPTWNRANVILEAIESLQAQTYTNWELEVVDDGSTDDTEQIIRELAAAEPRIRYCRIEHQGVSVARNQGLNQSRGDIVAYLDSDNIWDKDYLLIMMNALQESKIACAYCSMRVVDVDSSQITTFRKKSFNFQELLKNNYIDINVFVHKRDIVRDVGTFDTTLKRWVDWDFIIRCVMRYRPAQVPISLADYRVNMENQQITHQESFAYKHIVLNKYLIDWDRQLLELGKRVQGHISIIIPVYNQAALTRECLKSIFKNTRGLDFDVLIVDNKSSDGTVEMLSKLKREHNNLDYITNYENYGFALGCNLGVANTKGEYIVLLNNDTTVLKGWLDPLIDPLIEDHLIGIIGPKLLFPDDTLQCGGIVFNDQSKIPYHIYQGFPKDHPAINKRRIFQAVTGACFALRASNFIKLRGFDPLYINGGEDIDFCFRLRHKLGKKVFYNPKSVIYHHEGKTEGRSKDIMYNRQTFVERWGGEIKPDDRKYYAEDGYVVKRYVKKGSEPHGEKATYFPELEPAPAWICDKTRSILVVKPSGIGNMIMFTPALKALREFFPQARITIACYEPEADIIKESVDRVIILQSRHPKTGALDSSEFETKVRINEYDLAIYPPFTNLGKPTPYLKKVVPNHITHPAVSYDIRHEVLHNMDVIFLMGWAGDVPLMEVPIDSEAANGLPIKTIGIHMGASATIHMQKKKWPFDHWAALLDMIPEDYHIVFCGGPGEEEDVRRVVEQMQTRHLETMTSFVGKLSLKQTAGIIGACKLFISTDSGLMHMAAAIKTPVIGIFGPTLPSKNSPWGDPRINRVVTADVSCGPCYSNPKILFECPEWICLTGISAKQVFKVVAELLPGSADAPQGLDVATDQNLARMGAYWDACAKDNARKNIAICDWHNEEVFHESGRRDIRLVLNSPFISLPEGGSVLEIGAGIGRLLKPLALLRADLAIYGIDVSAEMVSRGKKRLKDFPNILLLATNGKDLSCFSDDFFDMIFSYIVFQHIPRHYVRNYFKEVRRTLKPRGIFRFQMQTSSAKNNQEPLDDDYRSIRYYSETQIRELCREFQFDVLELAGSSYLWVTISAERGL